jgi:hypothetical protein
VESRLGCNCEICQNPRKLYKGKHRHSLTLKEYNAQINENEEQE